MSTPVSQKASQPECRFCFEPERTSADPLIEPCPCKGSVQFVHWLCLKRWVQLNPQANGHACTICRLPFQAAVFPGLEQVYGPDFAIFCLRHTYVTTSVISYVLIGWNYQAGELARWELFRSGCLLSQLWYAFCLTIVWRVRNKELYRRFARASRLPWLLSVHVYSLSSILWSPGESHYICMVLIYLVLQMYWVEHMALLSKINDRILVED